MILYSEGSNTREQSLLFREHDEGAFRSFTLREEGVGDLHALSARAAQKKFVVLEVVGGIDHSIFRDHLAWTNTIVVDRSDRLPQDLRSFVRVNDQFLSMLPARELEAVGGKNLFVTVAHSSSGEELITIYTRPVGGKLLGQVHTVTRDNLRHHLEVLAGSLRKIGKGGRLYVIGDQPRLVKLDALADAAGIDVVRRSDVITKSLAETHRRLRQIDQRALQPETTAFVNGVPGTSAELKAMGRGTAGVNEWKQFRDALEARMNRRFSTRVASRKAFLTALTNGEKDFVIVVAHSDGQSIYLGSERVTFQELDGLPTRRRSSRPRVAILIACRAGELTTGDRTLFRRQVQSLGELLTKKNFFDEVIAPSHDVRDEETLAALDKLLAGKSMAELRKLNAGWTKIAGLLRSRPEAGT